MGSRASLARHPIHPMLIVFPIGLWIFAFIAHIIAAATHSLPWHHAALYTMAGGLIGAVLAAIPGFIDLLAMPRSRARTIGVWHMILNLIVLTLFAVAFFMRIAGQTGAMPWVLSILAVLLLGVSGWLGGHLVYVHGVAVEFEGKQQRQERIERKKLQDEQSEPSESP